MPPLSYLQALNVDDSDFSKNLIAALARYFNVSHVARIAYATMDEALRTAVRGTKPNATLQSFTPIQPTSTNPEPSEEGVLSSEEEEVLLLLRRVRIAPSLVTEMLNISDLKAMHFLESLKSNGYLESSYYMLNRVFGLSKLGADYLLRRNLLPAEDTLSEAEVRILMLVAKKKRDLKDIPSLTDLSTGKAIYYVGTLKAGGYVQDDDRIFSIVPGLVLTPKGREYLVKYGLV